jgi:glucose uptake protein GlcU
MVLVFYPFSEYMLKVMAVSLEFMRGILGIIGIGCAFMLGRSIIGVRRGWQKQSHVVGWAVRVILCLGAVGFRHWLDAADMIIGSVALVALAIGLWQTSRAKKEEDLTKEIFPE